MISLYNFSNERSIPGCDRYNPDNIFKRFKLIEFPTSFVGLFSSKILDVEVDLTLSAYLKTMCNNKLLKFEEAREISAPHRAFEISYIDNHTINITFSPKNECISKVKYSKQFDSRFVFDLRLIQVDGTRCCNNEQHSEIGRYYICGNFEYCTLTHQPSVVDFGEVLLNTKITKHVRIKNESKIAAKMKYVKVTGFEVTPQSFTIPPYSSKRLSVTIKPTCLLINNILSFLIRNSFDNSEELNIKDNNFLTYSIKIRSTIIYNKKPKIVVVESLHKLKEPQSKYTYLDKDLNTQLERQKVAFKYLEVSKLLHEKKKVTERFCTGNDKCDFYFPPSVDVKRTARNFCKVRPEKINTYCLFDILFHPVYIDFGRVGLNTYGEHELTIKNNTKYDISIKLDYDSCVLYTCEKVEKTKIQLKAMTETQITIFCIGCIEGSYEGTFEYTIDNKYHRKHPYRLQCGNPTLMVLDKTLKFGMVTTESFTTSVPVRIHNYFNVDVKFSWEEFLIDTPFEVIPDSGTVPKHMCKICDVLYVCKPTKTKTHEVDLVTESKVIKVIPIELSVVTRKLSIKFLQPAVLFKDIALNIESVQRVKLENSSREIALFHIVEPLIPGLRVEPMSGIIRPKTIITFDIIVKISCVLEFVFDIYVKINNKENVILPVSGNVIEPKLIIHPKYIYLARIPCDMITFVPITFQNIGTLKSIVEVLDTGDENIFNVYVAYGNEKRRVFKFEIEGTQSKTVYVKVYDIFRREYDMFIPFKINGLLGPPILNSQQPISNWTTELQHYTNEYDLLYESNPKVKIKIVNKDIAYCRMCGVITVSWIQFSVKNFELNYKPNANIIDFTMTNVSKYYLFVTIMISKLAPNFSLELTTEEHESIINETHMQFTLDREQVASFQLKFHPKGHGKFVTTALLYLDKHMTLPYYNLTFIGKRLNPDFTTSAHRIIFPPCRVGAELSRIITLTFEDKSENDAFSCISKDEPNLQVNFLNFEEIQEEDMYRTLVTVEILVTSQTVCARKCNLKFNHDTGIDCDIEVSFCFTYCPITLHTVNLVTPEENPYPYFPLPSQSELYEYLDRSSKFLEKWMFQQGFRRDLYPVIPDTFHAISTAISTSSTATKSKGINVTFLNFLKRIAGPLMKHVRKITVHDVDESFKCVKEIHDTYKEVLNLLKSRGTYLWTLQAKFLLSYDQFVVYTGNVTPKCNADIILINELRADVTLFNRLTRQCWFDFILQCYKVFIMDSCFFDCVCVSLQERDIIKVLIDWYNEQIALQHGRLRKNKPVKLITNLTTDLCDGIAITSSILSYCTFLKDHFSIFYEIDEHDTKGGIINNACLIIEAMNMLKLYFPLQSVDFLEPNFIHMFFLSVHLYVTLPMFKPKDTIHFFPPLLRSSTRQLTISPVSQETVTFNFMLVNNIRNSFIVEKAPPGENGKKLLLNVKYAANFTNDDSCILLVHGYNKTRIFDTYMIFVLHGQIGSLNAIRKCKVTGPLYRPNKVDILVSSPFLLPATFHVFLTDEEPTLPVSFDEPKRPNFYLRRLNLLDREITLSGLPKESGQEVQEHKLYLQMVCLSTLIGCTWIWFRSDLGEFFIKVTTQTRWDLAIDTLQAPVQCWPIDPCSCGEACECYRTTTLIIPHRNDLMLRALRYALVENASDAMMEIYDQLIETPTGKIILSMLLAEGGTNMSDVQHILRNEIVYRITSRSFLPRLEKVTMAHHTDDVLILPITLPARDLSEKFSVILTSECGMDIRTYKILIIQPSYGE